MKLKILSIVSVAVVMMLCISHIEANAGVNKNITSLIFAPEIQMYK